MSKIDRRLSATNDDRVKVYQYINYQNKQFLKMNKGGGRCWTCRLYLIFEGICLGLVEAMLYIISDLK